MLKPKQRMLKLLSTVTVGTTVTLGSWSAFSQIPIDRPVSEPVPSDILEIETLVKTALANSSEDKPIAVSQIKAGLASVDADRLNIALLDLQWLGKIEQVDDESYCLIRSGHG